MALSFQYRPRFVDIRVRPPTEDGPRADDIGALKPDERPCDHPDCRAAAAFRAPKSRDLLGEHYWFCQAHAAEYNRSWNFFAGMSEEEMREEMSDPTGGRPTWPFKASPQSREASAGPFRDPFNLFGSGGTRPRARGPAGRN